MTSRIAKLSRLRSAAVSYALTVTIAVAPVLALEANDVTPGQGGTQSAGPPRVENTQVVVNGAMVNVSYDLVASDPQTTFVVALEASQNGGKSYDLRPAAVTGDVGSGIRPGAGKKIVWEAAKDTDNLELAQFRFRVAVKPVASPQPTVAEAASQPSTSQPPSQNQKPVAVAAPPRQPPQPGEAGNRWLWPGLGMVGGGVVLGALGALGPLKKDDPFLPDCLSQASHLGFDGSVCQDAFADVETNTPVLGAGLGIAAAGVVLMLLGRGRGSQNMSVSAVPKGVSIKKTIRFDWPGLGNQK
jgi:hypothetical protein